MNCWIQLSGDLLDVEQAQLSDKRRKGGDKIEKSWARIVFIPRVGGQGLIVIGD